MGNDRLEFDAPSGAKVTCTLASYSISYDLLKSILKAIRQGGVGSKIPENLQLSDLAAIANKDIKDFGVFGDAVIDIITSPDVEANIFKCFERCTYNDQRLNQSTFENSDARGDLIFVAFKVGMFNIRPYWSHLLSGLKDMFQVRTASQSK